jgi:hypothetical protein
MSIHVLKIALAIVALIAPIEAFAADGVDPSGANSAMAPVGAPPPEKVAPNTATAPGVMAPKATPSAGAIIPNPSATTPPAGNNSPNGANKNPN